MQIAHTNSAAVDGDIFRLQLAVDLLFGNAKLRQPLPREFQEHDFLLLSPELDFFHVGHREQFAPQKIGIPAQLGL